MKAKAKEREEALIQKGESFKQALRRLKTKYPSARDAIWSELWPRALPAHCFVFRPNHAGRAHISDVERLCREQSSAHETTARVLQVCRQLSHLGWGILRDDAEC